MTTMELIGLEFARFSKVPNSHCWTTQNTNKGSRGRCERGKCTLERNVTEMMKEGNVPVPPFKK